MGISMLYVLRTSES